MGIIGIVRSTARLVRNGAHYLGVTFDTNAGNLQRGEQYTPAGDDYNPLPDDYLFSGGTDQEGRNVPIGYVDAKNPGITLPGERRIYARNADGEIVCQLHLRANGDIQLNSDTTELVIQEDDSIFLRNQEGNIKMFPDGTVNINGLEISPNGQLTLVTGIVVDTHLHTETGSITGGPQNP